MLSDPGNTLYLLLIVVFIITMGVWWRLRSRRAILAVIVAAGLFGLLYLLDTTQESPREEAVRRVQLMAEAATAIKPDAFIEHVSPRFQVAGSNRDALKTSRVWSLIQQHNARVAVWNFERDDVEYSADGNEVQIGFYAKGQARDGGFVMRYIRAKFCKDTDGNYRLFSMKFYNPAGAGMRSEEPIPGFP
ncbi:MAG: hypothetical protein ACRCZF_16185 [Gemmataceae bacterium]